MLTDDLGEQEEVRAQRDAEPTSTRDGQGAITQGGRSVLILLVILVEHRVQERQSHHRRGGVGQSLESCLAFLRRDTHARDRVVCHALCCKVRIEERDRLPCDIEQCALGTAAEVDDLKRLLKGFCFGHTLLQGRVVDRLPHSVVSRHRDVAQLGNSVLDPTLFLLQTGHDLSVVADHGRSEVTHTHSTVLLQFIVSGRGLPDRLHKLLDRQERDAESKLGLQAG